MLAAAEGHAIAARDDIDGARPLVPPESPIATWLTEVADAAAGRGLGQQASTA